MSAGGAGQRDGASDRRKGSEALGLLLFRGVVAVFGLFMLAAAAVISSSGHQGSIEMDGAAVLAGVGFLCGLLFVDAGRRQAAAAGRSTTSADPGSASARGKNWPKIVTGLLIALLVINLPHAFEPDGSPALMIGLLLFFVLIFLLLSGWTPSRVTRIRPNVPPAGPPGVRRPDRGH